MPARLEYVRAYPWAIKRLHGGVYAIAAIAHAGLPTRMSDIRNAPFDADRLIRHMGHDKKAEGGTLTFVLVRGIGQAYVAKKVDPEAIAEFLILDGAEASSQTLLT